MSGITFSKNLQTPAYRNGRDSLELASLASSPNSDRTSLSSASATSSRKLSLENEDQPINATHTDGQRPRHNRTYSVSSVFDFTANLFPLSASAIGGYAPVGAPDSATFAPNDLLGGPSLEKQKSLTYLNGVSILIGIIIGSGIFSSPSQVNANAGSPGASLVVWAVAGCLVWTGAASYAELGGALPLNGGPQVYLSKIFGELAGFLFTWCAVWVLKPGGAAIVSIIFGEYIVRAVVGADMLHISPWINKGVGIGGLWLVTLLNSISTRLTTKVTDLFMFFKFIALLGVTITGVVVAITGFSWKGKANNDWKDRSWFEGTTTDVSAWAVALYAGLWAFDGWDNVNYVVGEFRNPSRDVHRAIHTSIPLVILFYVLANVAYFFVLPFETVESSNTVAVQFGSAVFGPVGSLVLALVVSASCFSSLNAATFTTGRLIYVASKEGHLPSLFGRLGFWRDADSASNRLRTRSWAHKRLSRLIGDENGIGFTPINALVLNASLTTVYILVGEFRTLITFYGVAGYTFYFLTVLGLIVLRVKEPTLERPYRTWISTPIIFCCVSLFLLSRAVFAEPKQTVIVVGFVVAGVLVYFWRIKGRDGKKRGMNGVDKRDGWRFWKRWRWRR